MKGVYDKNAALTLNPAQQAARSINLEYKELIGKLKEAGAKPFQIAAAKQVWGKELASVIGPNSQTVKDMMESTAYGLATIGMNAEQKQIYDIKKQLAEDIKTAKEYGASTKQIAKIQQLANLQIKEITDAKFEAAVDSIKSFKKALIDTADATANSAVAQAKLFNVLSQVKKSDFSGLEGLTDILNDIKINKADYKSAIEYGRAFWSTLIAASQIETIAGKAGKLPGYADGGYHSGGLRVVGENGAEVEYTGPSLIYNRDQLVDVSALLAELRALRAEVKYGNYAVAKNTMKTAESLQRIEYDGIYLDAGNL
jgi:hypothetical protein